MKQLEGRVAIVTGASSGIGQVVAEAYAAEGARTVLAARRRDLLDGIVRGIAAAGGEALAIPTDVTREDEVLALFRQVTERFGRLDILVNNAGMTVPTPTDELSVEMWRRIVDVNLTGAFICSREALRVMKKQGAGRIINVGSISAKVPRENSVAYAATKFGIEGLTRSLALDARSHGIAVSVIHPGNTAAGFGARASEEDIRAGRHMRPTELARVFVLVAALAPEINMLETVALPLAQPFLGRG